MERDHKRVGQSVGRPRQGGGITRLANSLYEHRGAIEYDLLTKTGHSIDDIGRTLPWDALDSFFRHLGPESALMRELFPEQTAWAGTQRTNMILVDIWDMLAQINANVVAIAERKPARKPPKYKTPWRKPDVEERHIGKGPLPPKELHAWIENKRKTLCQKLHKRQ